MAARLKLGDCVRIPDGRVARVREITQHDGTVRVRRTTSKTHQFLRFAPDELERLDCPKGWMSPEGYVRYLDATLAKMNQRQKAKGRSKSRRT